MDENLFLLILLLLPITVGFICFIVSKIKSINYRLKHYDHMQQQNIQFEDEISKLKAESKKILDVNFQQEGTITYLKEKTEKLEETLKDNRIKLANKETELIDIVNRAKVKIAKLKIDFLENINDIEKDYQNLKDQHLQVSGYVAEIMADYYTYVIFKEANSDFLKKTTHFSSYEKQVKHIIKELVIKQYDLFNFIDRTNLKAIPYAASVLADYQTYYLEILAEKLDWGFNQAREKKVDSIRELRHKTTEQIQQNLEAKYQLDYLLNLFPSLSDVIQTDYKDLPSTIKLENLSEYDKSRDWLSKEEYQKLSSTERNQLALDRYKESHTKTKWQIGRDYELYVAYLLESQGYKVDTYGSYMGLEDLGRDLIAKKDNKTLIIQCKFWGKEKLIHEKHITQLYGTVASYCVENNLFGDNVVGVLITNIKLSDTAKKMANYLKVNFVEQLDKGDYPCIKCNINRNEYGNITKIYHLPFDQKYDDTKINEKGEFYAMTVKEAEDAGFRRAFKWYGC